MTIHFYKKVIWKGNWWIFCMSKMKRQINMIIEFEVGINQIKELWVFYVSILHLDLKTCKKCGLDWLFLPLVRYRPWKHFSRILWLISLFKLKTNMLLIWAKFKYLYSQGGSMEANSIFHTKLEMTLIKL